MRAILCHGYPTHRSLRVLFLHTPGRISCVSQSAAQADSVNFLHCSIVVVRPNSNYIFLLFCVLVKLLPPLSYHYFEETVHYTLNIT